MRVLFVSTLLVVTLAAQAPQQPTFRTGTNLVQVDALVTDPSGNPLSDLTAADFDVTDDGAPVPITAFRFISAAAAANWRDDGVISPIRNVDDESREAAIEGVRVFAIFLDEYHVERFNAIRVVPGLVDFVRSLPAADLLAVYGVMDLAADVRLTREREPAIKKLQAFQGRMGDYFPPKNLAEEEHIRKLPAIEQLRMQVSTSAIEALVSHLGAISDRRKSVLMVTERVGNGYGNSLFEAADYLTTMVGVANRVNVSLYPIDPGGLRVTMQRGAGMSMIDMFRTLADQTGGRAIVNQNDFQKTLGQVNRDASAYYLLGFVSSHPSDGKYHKIAIRVKRRGVLVRAREGYLSPKADEMRTTSAAPVVPAEVTSALSRLADALRPAGNELIVPRRAFEAAAARPTTPSAALLDTPSIVVLHASQPDERPGRPEFERSQRIAIRAGFRGEEAPEVTASLLGRTGQELTKLPVTVASGRAEVILALANLGAGDYVVRLAATRGTDRIDQYVALRVLR